MTAIMVHLRGVWYLQFARSGRVVIVVEFFVVRIVMQTLLDQLVLAFIGAKEWDCLC